MLLADDDERSAFSIRSILESEGLNVIRAADGKEAIEMVERNTQIDTVLTNVMMAVMNSMDAIRALLEQKIYRHLPIFTVTAKAKSGDREECLRSGANDYISKPVDTGRLKSLLKIWLTSDETDE